jgi:8-oxo-dGTP pyrophosphatase MutT (NUDIX family)
MSAIDTECLSNKDQFLTLVVKRLGRCSLDYTEKMRFIQTTRKTENAHFAAGVLLLLYFKSIESMPGNNNKGEFFFQLIKRSSKVTQPGDLSCPGGLLHNFLDPLLRPLITSGLISPLQGDGLKYVQMRDIDTSRIITLFLTNAVRETWEETGLRPWEILFLGPLPSYSLHLFRRTIFPLVGFVKREWNFHPNQEVDTIVEIPLVNFFDESNYGLYHIETSNQLNTNRQIPREFPCLITRDHQGKEEILWGATFTIIVNFLKIVLNFEIPALHKKRIIKRTLGPEYLTGHQK